MTPVEDDHGSVEVTLVTGLDQDLIGRTTADLTAGLSALVVEYTVAQDGPLPVLLRRTRDGDDVTEELVATSHGCIGCAVRDDALVRLVDHAADPAAADVVVVLPAGSDPACVVDPIDLGCWIDETPVRGRLAVRCVVTAVDGEQLVERATSDLEVADAGIPYGPYGTRPLAEVLVHQVGQADVLAVHRLGPADDPDARQARTLLDHLAPHAAVERGELGELVRCTVGATRHDPRRTALTHENVGVPHQAAPDADGVATLVWRARRPMHPARVYDALETAAGECVLLRGHGWVANRPHEVLRLDVAGGAAAITCVDAWLAEAPDHVWEAVSPHRRTHASMAWDAYYGDREQELLVVVVAEDVLDDPRERIREALERTLLTDEELAGGADLWASFDDPFERWLGEPWAAHPEPPQGVDEPCDGVHGVAHESHAVTEQRVDDDSPAERPRP